VSGSGVVQLTGKRVARMANKATQNLTGKSEGLDHLGEVKALKKKRLRV